MSRVKVYAKGYGDAGASTTKRALKGFLANSGAPSEDIDFYNSTLRQRGRMLYMAAPVASAAINTNRTKIVGPGLHMKCAINRELLKLSDEEAKEWQKTTEAEFCMWAESKSNCDALGMNNFYELQQLALKSWLTSGDVFALMKRYERTVMNPYTLRIHLIEADRVSNPNSGIPVFGASVTTSKAENGNTIYDGVEVDSFGKVVAYYVCNTYPGQCSINLKPEWTRIEAIGKLTDTPNILHIMEAERPDQYRGVTYLAPVIELLLQLRRYTESELTAAIVQSFLTAWITTEAPANDLPFNETGAGDYFGNGAEQPDNISESDNDYEMGPGTINVLNPGEKVTLGNPNIPTAGFDSFLKALCRLTGSALELPYDVLIKEFNSSYSAAKGALEEAWEAIKMRRSWFVSDFCQPIYEIWLSEAVAIGRIKAPGFFTDPRIRAAWCGTRWDGPAQTHLDPVKEANANSIIVDRGWKTNEQITREFYGGNWEENADILRREKETISKAFGDSTNPSANNVENDDEGEDGNAE